MGIVRMGVPEELTLFLKEHFKSEVLIETGTFYGSTTLWASKHFKKVHTIEFSEQIYQVTSQKYTHVPNISFHYGDSRKLLKNILQTVTTDQTIILWLDAHWSSGETYGETDNCPLIKELEIIEQSKKNACILIDDARLFVVPPPKPSNYHQYPGIQDIVKIYGDDKFIAIYEDVIIIVPSLLKSILQEYLQFRTTADWQEFGKRQKISFTGKIRILKGRIVRKLFGK